MNIDNMNLKEIKEWVDDEGYLDNVYDPITENTFYWLIKRIEKCEEALNKIIDIYNHSEPCRNAFIANDLVVIARKAREEK